MNENIVGNQYGHLTVQKLAYKKNRKLYYTCLCECGCEVDVRKDQLTRGITKSCGCLHKDIAKKTMAENMKKYGLSNHPLNGIYNGMKQRCYNENDKGFKYYGGRGISICNEWLNDFKAFYNWAVENGYKSGLTIDRVDVNGNYTPKNCRFVSMKIQNVNKKSNVFIEYKGETKTLSEWCEKLRLSRFLAGIIFYTREVLLTSHYEKRLFEHASQPRVACADIRLLSYLWSRTNLSRDSYQSG